MQWENVTIFISSTFNDMHAERDYLVKRVFPQLSEWCEQRKLRLIDIDLRWGVTAADSEAKNTVRACLRNIDECRPFFLCFLGQRRGWVPGVDDIGKDTYDLFPKLLEGQYAGEASVTEMEILHALIDPLHNGILRGTKDDSRSGQAVEHAFFFLREPNYLDGISNPDLLAIYTNAAERDKATAEAELARWREREIPQTGRPVFSYTAQWNTGESTPEIALPLVVPTTAPKDSAAWKNAFAGWKARWASAGVTVDDSGEISGAALEAATAYNDGLTSGRLGNFQAGNCALAQLVIEQLKGAIEKRFPDHMVAEQQTPLQKELDQQAQFARVASEGFIERAGDFDALSAYLQNSETRPFAVTAYAGMGKTSLLAHFIDTHNPQPGESLHYRFIGGSDDSVSAERLVRSLLSELKEAGKIDSDIPADYAKMINRLPALLAEAGAKGKTVLVIDALNQLESGMKGSDWIPTALPENVKLVVSFKVGEESADAYYRNQKESGGMILYGIKPFDSEADRKSLVAAYLEQYFKELDEPRIQALIRSDGADNPLFLKAALSELRVFGVHNDLSEVIRSRFGSTPVMAFHAILSRMESDPAYTKLTPAIALPHIFGWLAHSRYGLSVEELAGLLLKEGLTDSEADAMDAVYLIIRQLRPFMAKRDGRMDFFYESFKIAAAERYTGEHAYARPAAGWHRSLAEYFETLSLEDRHKLSEQAYQYANAGMGDKLHGLLTDYDYLEARLDNFDIWVLLADFELASGANAAVAQGDKAALAAIRAALRDGTATLHRQKDQLAAQMWGRLDRSVPALEKFLQGILEKKWEPWLRPVFTCFATSSSSFIRSVIVEDAHKRSVPYFSADGKKLLHIGESVAVRELETGKLLREHVYEFNAFASTVDPGRKHYYRHIVDAYERLDFESGEVVFTSQKSVVKAEKPKNTFEGMVFNLDKGRLEKESPDKKRASNEKEAGPGAGQGQLRSTIRIEGLAFSGDGRYVIGFGTVKDQPIYNEKHGGSLSIWNDESGECVALLEGLHYSPFDFVKANRDASLFVSGAAIDIRRKDIRYPDLTLWRFDPGKAPEERISKVRDLPAGGGQIRAAAFLSDNKSVLLGGTGGGTVRLFDTETGNVIREYVTGAGAVSAIVLSGDDSFFVCAADEKIEVWGTHDGVLKKTMQCGDGEVSHIDLSPGGRYVVSLSGGVGLWDLAVCGSEEEEGAMRGAEPENAAESSTAALMGGHVVEISPDGRHALVGTHIYNGPNPIRLIDCRSCKVVAELAEYKENIVDFYFNKAGNIALARIAGKVRSMHQHWREPDQIAVFDLEARRCIAEYELPKPPQGAAGSEFAETGALSPDGSTFLSGDKKGVFQRDVLNGEIKREYVLPSKALDVALDMDSMTISMTAGSAKKDLVAANYSPDGKYALAAYGDGTVGIWDAASGQFIKELSKGVEIGLRGREAALGENFVAGFAHKQFTAMDGDNRHVVVGTYDGSLKVLGFDGKQPASFAKFTEKHLSADLSYYLGNSSEQCVELVKLHPARRAARFTALSIRTVAMTPDMSLIVAINPKETFILKAENLDGTITMADDDWGVNDPISAPAVPPPPIAPLSDKVSASPKTAGTQNVKNATVPLSRIVVSPPSHAPAPDKGAGGPKTAGAQNEKNTRGFLSRIFGKKK